jgi:hypothetical protein
MSIGLNVIFGKIQKKPQITWKKPPKVRLRVEKPAKKLDQGKKCEMGRIKLEEANKVKISEN